MKLTVKSIKQQAYDVEVDSEGSVKDLKVAIETKHGFEHSTLKLLFKGQLLDDSKSLKDYSITENEVLVMMNMKAKPVNVPKEEEKKQEQTKPQENKPSTTTSTQPQQPKPTTTVKPEKDYSAQVAQLQDMGFSAAEAKNAIKAARGNVELAIEFLYNGIPENLPEEDTNAEDLGINSPDKLLKNMASVIKVACQGNPGNLPTLMMSLEQTQPELVMLIRQNEEQFKNLITQPINDEDIRIFQSFTQQGRSGGHGTGGSGGRSGGSSSGSGQQQAGRGQIKLSKEEFDAINRLKGFGFSEIDCVQAYFAFEKNEEMALNFLFDNKQQEDFSNLNIVQNQNQGSEQSNENKNVQSTDSNFNQGEKNEENAKHEGEGSESKKNDENK
jgi:UV excision repair protein RAD23